MLGNVIVALAEVSSNAGVIMDGKETHKNAKDSNYYFTSEETMEEEEASFGIRKRSSFTDSRTAGSSYFQALSIRGCTTVENSGHKTDDSFHNHPLLNSLIAYNVMTYLPRKDLLNCRLVCTPWDTEACRLLRKVLLLEFQDICHISKFKFLMDQNLIKKPNREVPFAKIYLRSTFRLGHFIKQLQIAKVGCDCGANFFQKLLFYQTTYITSLDLQIISAPIRLSPVSEYSKYLRIKTPKRLSPKWRLPNLKQLHLRHQLFTERPRFIEDLLEAVVNLEVLKTDEASPLFCRSVFVPKVLSSRNRWNKLKRLLVGDMLYFTNQQMLKFAEMKFHLEYLPLNFNILVPSLESVDVKNLLVLLVSLQDHLKKLELFNHRPDLNVDLITFPRMKKLESLKVTNISFPFISLQELPNLKILSVVHETNTMYNSILSLKIPPHPVLSSVGLCPMVALNLSHLRDWMAYWDLNAKSYVSELASAFPSLRTLSINGNDSVLKNIYEKMPLLETLTIHGPITDEGITGISLELCQRMHSDQDYGLVDSDELDQLRFIGDLKKIRKITIASMGNRSLLTEVSVFLGFVCCADLINLDIGNRELVDLWKAEVERLRGSSTVS
ncbi:hypothetical protein Ocin01_00811 [Orchesella cincta]|uniref:F-box domain-containing protein n=1 Tax=Orchesella cincta TaxID=48709 RepID=A0A1D2NKT7_ORCCI|nr:hypothetical protein Ocin01_00811 [Orchesella cincta]